MRLFTKHEATPKQSVAPTVWPEDSLDDIDDLEFARAIAEGRIAEQRELVTT